MRHRAALSSLAVLAVLGAVAAGWGLYSVYSPRPAGETGAGPVLFTVETGESFSSVAKRLAAIGLVERPRALVAYAWLRGWDRRVKAGTYSLAAGDRPRDVVEKLVIGQVFKVAVTVPEGFRHAQIAAAIAAATPVDSASFSELLTDGDALGELGVEGPSLEGYLFPDTYLVPWGMNARRIAAMMKARLDEVFDADLRRRSEELGLTLHETLTLASIIQAETRLPDELRLVSAVYHNRLRRGMRLEADPTVAYALGGYKGRLYYKDLETASPYNTYRIEGLPPGPICAPGKAAILAALYPDTTCRALYFVARGDGGHVFSSTLDEHLRAVESARKARAAPGSK